MRERDNFTEGIEKLTHCFIIMIAPKQFDQYLILNQVVDIPDSTALAQSILETPVYKRDQPEGLQMRFKPYGYYSGKL
jgi:hypothetical protein